MRKLWFLLAAFLLQAVLLRGQIFAQNLKADPQNESLGFVEHAQEKSLVIWKDMMIPKDKDYDVIVVMKGNIQIFGHSKRLVVVAGNVILEKTSVLDQDPVVFDGRVEVKDGAKVGVPIGEDKEIETPKAPDDEPTKKRKMTEFFHKLEEKLREAGRFVSEWPWQSIFGWFGQTVFLVILGILLFFASFLMILLPDFFHRAERYNRRRFVSALLWGTLANFLFAPVLVLLALSVVGILVIPFLLLFALLVWIFGFLVVSLTLGNFILEKVGAKSPLIGALLGAVLLFGVNTLPMVGPSIFLVAILAGIGAVLKNLMTPAHV